MFDRHQAEITVMRFTGHSLLVHQSMSVPWEFFFSSSHFISQFSPTRFPPLSAIGMCHFLPAHHLEWHFEPGQKPKYNIGTPRNFAPLVASTRIIVGALIFLLKVIFTNHSARAGYDTRSIFKRCLTGSNSEFSFS